MVHSLLTLLFKIPSYCDHAIAYFYFRNQVSDPRHRAELWRCDSCSSLLDPDSCNNIDTQSHILWCPAYRKLREGKSLDNDKDIVNYFRQVMVIRSKLKLTK